MCLPDLIQEGNAASPQIAVMRVLRQVQAGAPFLGRVIFKYNKKPYVFVAFLNIVQLASVKFISLSWYWIEKLDMRDIFYKGR